MPSSSRGSENVSKGGHTTDHLSLPSDTPNVSVPPKISVPSEASDVWMELSTHLPTATGHSKPTHEDSVAAHSDSDTDGQKLLLFYILGTVVAISLLLALALGLLIYRKRRAKKEEIKEKKPQNAADSYSWVPERAESRALENQYSPAPGTDCWRQCGHGNTGSCHYFQNFPLPDEGEIYIILKDWTGLSAKNVHCPLKSLVTWDGQVFSSCICYVWAWKLCVGLSLWGVLWILTSLTHITLSNPKSTDLMCSSGSWSGLEESQGWGKWGGRASKTFLISSFIREEKELLVLIRMETIPFPS